MFVYIGGILSRGDYVLDSPEESCIEQQGSSCLQYDRQLQLVLARGRRTADSALNYSELGSAPAGQLTYVARFAKTIDQRPTAARMDLDPPVRWPLGMRISFNFLNVYMTIFSILSV